MSETWLYAKDSVIECVLTPELHVLYHIPRPNVESGGYGCLINNPLWSKIWYTKMFESFQCMKVQLSNKRKKVILDVIYTL